MVEVVLQVLGQELLLLARGGPVSPYAEQQVVALGGPVVAGRFFTDHPAERRFEVLSFGILYLSVETPLYDIARARRAVVIEEVIAVDAVLGAVVLGQEALQLHLLVGRQVEHLFGDHSPPLAVVVGKGLKLGDTQFVVGQSEDEAQYEERLLEVEDAPVEGQVLSRVQVVPSQGRMAVEAIHLLMWCTRQEAHLDRVEISRTYLPRQLCLGADGA